MAGVYCQLGDRFSTRHLHRPGIGPDGNTCQKLGLCRLLRMEMSKPRHCMLYAMPTSVTRAPIFITMREHSFAINLQRFADIRRPRFRKLNVGPSERIITSHARDK